jgi:HSP20 family protein
MSNITLWTRRNPFAEFDALVRRAFTPAGAARVAGPARAFTPAADLVREGDDAVVRLELPGLDAEKDVAVEIKDNRLVVSGERRDERSEEGDRGRFREVRYGSFRRTFTLPAHVTADAVTASYDAGVLTVKVAGAYTGSEATRIAGTSGAKAEAIEA